MDRISYRLLPRLLTPRRLASLGAIGLTLPLGCAQFRPSSVLEPPAPPLPAVVRAQLGTPEEMLPAPQTNPQAETVSPQGAAAPAKVLPINLDTVLHLGQDQNVKVNLAREKLQESYASRDLAAKAWLPNLYIGTSYYRHDGGIQDFNGNLVHSDFGSLFAGGEVNANLDLRDAVYQKVQAERAVWQQKGEVSRITSENLLDATSTYVDLLTARSAEVIALDMEIDLSNLLKRAQDAVKTEPGLQIEVDMVEAEIESQRQTVRKLRENATAAAAKLVYLLGLDPCSELVLTERHMVPFHFVDASLPACDLVAHAEANGPGVHEMEGLLALIHDANAKAQGLSRFIPSIQARMAEGAFGAGPGASSTWDNRFDLGLQVRWNVTEMLTARERQRVNQAKTQQAHLGFADLKARLAMGVQEAREASLSNTDQFRTTQKQIASTQAMYKLSLQRFDNRFSDPKRAGSANEVMMSIRALGGARLNYLTAVRDHDKAQLRLMVLMGGATGGGPADCAK